MGNRWKDGKEPEDYEPPASQNPNRSKAKINRHFLQPFILMKERNVKEIKITSDRLYINFPSGGPRVSKGSAQPPISTQLVS